MTSSRVVVPVFALVLTTSWPAMASGRADQDETEIKGKTETTETMEGAAPAEASAAEQGQGDSDLDFQPAQPDFTVITLPTTLRLPRFKSAFRVTHRFARPLGQGDFGDLLEDFFGFDSGAQIGLEYRFGIMRGTQVGIHRTSERTIEFFGEYSLLSEGTSTPFGLAVLASIDGTNNFRDSYSPGLGVVVSRTLGEYGAVYAEPIWVNNTNPLPSELVDDNDTFMFGLGARLRIRPTVYVAVEAAPGVGYDQGAKHLTFALEKRAGGHLFQINFSNNIGTTFAQLARGGSDYDTWYLGFNISRKFFR
jgi:hypothetical protein